MTRWVLVDSDILIDVSRKFEPTISLLKETAQTSRITISVVTQMELLVGCRDRAGLQITQRFLSRFDVMDMNEDVSRQAVALIVRYNLSHGLLIPDALIAATALVTGASLLTKNQRDFRFIEGLNLLAYET